MSALFDPLDPSVAFVFDTLEKESFHIESQVTEHPVEKSSLNADTVPDHVINKQVNISVSGTISNTPLLDRGGFETAVENIVIASFSPFQVSNVVLLGAGGFNEGVEVFGNIIRQEQQTIAFTSLKYAQARDFVDEEIRKLVQWRKSSKLLTWFALSGHTVDNLLITAIDTDLEGRVPNAIASAVVSIELKRVKIVSTVAVTAPKPKEARGLPKKNLGKSEPTSMTLNAAGQPATPSVSTFEGPGGDGGGTGAPGTNPNEDTSGLGGNAGTGENNNSPFVEDVDGKPGEWQFGSPAGGSIGIFGSY